MNSRELLCLRLLLIMAYWIAPQEWRADIKSFATHLQVHVKPAD